MTYNILASGSSGNAVVINGEILIDIGVPYKTLEKSGYIKGLKLVLLTHVHRDHFNPATVRRIHMERPALRFGCYDWMIRSLLKAGVEEHSIDVYEPWDKGPFNYNSQHQSFSVSPVELVHDAKNCGYRIFISDIRIFYATDTATLDHIEAKDYSLYMLESNHAKAEIESRIAEKQARGEFAYELRAARNHLSREQAEEWLARNAGPNSRYVFLHQHKEAHDG